MPVEKVKRSFRELMRDIKQFIIDVFDVKKGTDRKGTIASIKKNIDIKGTNVWLLIASIMVASLGLDQNSPAVIIGAMLISPLMSPILGVGLSASINDKDMMENSIQNFLISVVVALATSFIYFKLTPFGDATPEILARTKPTILDVLVAFFGGLAGIVSVTRKEISNAIPGVAIATALMPPLCVTGYGLANAEWGIMMKSFYLFFLNATFVALATYLITRYLRFPFVEYLDLKEKKRNRWIISTVSLVMIVPSFFILSGVLAQLKEKKSIQNFVDSNFKNYITRINDKTGDDTLSVKVYLFDKVPADSIRLFKEKFDKLGYAAKLDIVLSDFAGQDFKKEDFENIGKSIKDDLLKIMESDKIVKKEKDKEIEKLTHKLDSLRSDKVVFDEVTKEIKVLFPNVEKLGFAKARITDYDTTLHKTPVLMINWNKKKNRYRKKRDEQKIAKFVRLRMKLDTLVVQALSL